MNSEQANVLDLIKIKFGDFQNIDDNDTTNDTANDTANDTVNTNTIENVNDNNNKNINSYKTIHNVFFFECFKEEEKKFRLYLEDIRNINAQYTELTIQEWLVQTDMAKPVQEQSKTDILIHCPTDLISIRTQSIVPERWINSGTLKGILSRSTGYDHLQRYGTVSGIGLGYLPHYCSRSVAEHATVLWMSLLKKIPQQREQWKTFNRNNLTGREFMSKNILVVGVGNIGYQVIEIAKRIGLNALGVDINKKHSNVKYVNLKHGLKRADIIVCCMNLTPNNRDYFEYGVLKKAKKGVIFVNVSRGELSPCQDLLLLIKEGHLGGVGMDVYPNENGFAVKLRNGIENDLTEEDMAILEMSTYQNVILTPHNAFNSEESLDRKVKDSITQTVNFLETGGFVWTTF